MMEYRRTGLAEGILLLALVLAVGLVISAYLYSGPNPFYDDVTYIFLSRSAIVNGFKFMFDRFGFGPLSILQISVFFYLFGYGNMQAVAASAIDYTIMVYLIFVCGRKIGKPANWFGFLAALIGGTAPFVVPFVFRALIDIPLGMVAALSVYLFIKTTERRHNLLFPTLFGLTSASLIFVKIEGYMILVASSLSILILFLIEKFDRKWSPNRKQETGLVLRPSYVLLFAAGIISVLVIEFLVYYLLTDQPFFVLKYYNNNIPNTFGLMYNAIVTFVPYVLPQIKLHMALINSQIPGPLIGIAVIGGVIAVIKRNKIMTYMFLVYIIGVIYFIIGPNSLSLFFYNNHPYNTILLQGRYFIILLPYMSLLAAYLLFFIFEVVRKTGGWRVGSMVVVVTLLCIFALELPLYSTFHLQNVATLQNEALFGSVAGYVSSLAGNSIATIYTNSNVKENDGFALSLYESMMYYLRFNQEYKFKTINFPFFKANNSDTCTTEIGNSFLVDLYTLNNSAGNLAVINDWLGSNCTATYMRGFNINTKVSSTYIRVYRIEANG